MVGNFILNEAQRNISNSLPLMLISLIIIGFIIAFFAFVFKNIYEKYLNQQLVQNEIEHSLRLLETFYSVRHEYQNCLQVLKLMTALGATEKMDKYLSDIMTQMTNFSGFTQIDDPVLAASIISHQVKAKEYNILIKVNCSAPLKGISNISVSLGEIFNLFLDLMIESMTSLKGLGNEILVSIEEKGEKYSFEFKVDSFIDVSTVSVSSALRDKISIRRDRTGSSQRIDEVKEKIRELKGNLYYVVKDNYILRLKLTVNKQNDNSSRARLFQNNKAISV